jgi:hypothetical protein
MKFNKRTDIISERIYQDFLIDYNSKLNKLGYVLNDASFESFFYLEDDINIKKAINNTLNSIDKLQKQGKNDIYIQDFIDSNYYVFLECLPAEIKENKEELTKISKLYNKKSTLERLKMLDDLRKVTMNKGLYELNNKQKYLAICLEDPLLLENKKLSLLLKGLPIAGLFQLHKDLENKKERSKKNSYIRRVLEEKSKKDIKKDEKNKEKYIYNNEYYEFIKDPKLSRSKIDAIKHAYFQNGINLDDFKKDLGKELYKCSKAQLENYVEMYTRYQDGFLNKEEFTFSKKLIHEESLPQEELKRDVLPIIEKYDLTERQIKECIDIGNDRGKGDTKVFLDLAIEAKEHGYSNFEINELLEDSREDSVKTAYYKKEMIEEYGKDNITSIENLNNFTEKEMKFLLDEKSVAKELNESKEPITHERLDIEM